MSGGGSDTEGIAPEKVAEYAEQLTGKTLCFYKIQILERALQMLIAEVTSCAVGTPENESIFKKAYLTAKEELIN